jgi:hypothetical protein
VGSQGFVVRQLPYPSALNWTLKNTRTRIGQFRRVTYHAYIRGEVLFACPHFKQARRCHDRRLAITPPRHPGPCLRPFSSCYPHGSSSGDLPQDSAYSTTRYSPFKILSHTSHNRSPASKLARPVWAPQVSKSLSSRFLQYSSSISTASDTMRPRAV